MFSSSSIVMPSGMPSALSIADNSPPVADSSTREVVIEKVDALGRRVDEVHPTAVAAPRETVRNREASEYLLARPVRLDPVKGGGTGREVEGHGPRVEASDGIAFRVVHPVRRDIALDRRRELEAFASAGDRCDPVPHGEHKATPAPGDDGANLLAHGKRAGGSKYWVVAEDGPRAHVHEQQRLGLLVPERALAYVGMHIGCDLDLDAGKAGHVLPLSV